MSKILLLSVCGFNSRTPGGVRLLTLLGTNATAMFQFTHPGRGATALFPSLPRKPSSFNSRTPGGVRLPRGALARSSARVSIHAPREGCDGG